MLEIFSMMQAQTSSNKMKVKNEREKKEESMLE